MLKESSIERDKKYGEKILQTLQTLKEEINEIKVNQKEFEEKIRKQEQIKYKILNEIIDNSLDEAKRLKGKMESIKISIGRIIY
jgi:DNA gyrase/topoisomerase IV subunit B